MNNILDEYLYSIRRNVLAAVMLNLMEYSTVCANKRMQKSMNPAQCSVKRRSVACVVVVFQIVCMCALVHMTKSCLE